MEEVQGRAGEGLAEEHGALSVLSTLPEPHVFTSPEGLNSPSFGALWTSFT